MTFPYQDPTQPQDSNALPAAPGPYPPGYGQPVSPAPYGYAQPQVVVVQAPPTSTYAIIALIFSILGLVVGCCSFGVFSIVAIICGHVALSETGNNAQVGGRGMATASLVMGYLGVAPALFLSVTWFIGAATGGAGGAGGAGG